jgi:Domain of Unknown Function (DUF1080)
MKVSRRATLVATAWAALSVGFAQNKNLSTWIALFDGRSLAGWIPEQSAQWRVVQGAIVSEAGGDGWLRSERRFQDFILRLQYRNSPKGNSGVFLRASQKSNNSDPANPATRYELQISNENRDWPTGSIENFIPRLAPVSPAPNQWHSYEVKVQRDRMMATLDGTKVLDGRNSKWTEGFIGLQHHQGNKIEFRNIEIQELPR